MIDSHCHLDHEPLYDNLKDVISRSKQAGITKLLTICTNLDSFENIKKIIKIDPIIYGTFGIHPHDADKNIISKSEIIKYTKISEKIIGIGETGLDFYYNHSDKKSQKECFLKHIQASQETSKTLIVHSRSAEDDTFDILSNEIKNKKFNVLMHCFTGSKEFAHKLLDIGCYFSASGIVTFKKNDSLADTFKSIPNNKILIETDSPYLSPEPLRGKSNEPSHLIHTLKFIAKIKDESEKTISLLTSKNFFDLFNLKL